MNKLTDLDLEIINECCPEGCVPVYVVKQVVYTHEIHKKIRLFYKKASELLGEMIPFKTFKSTTNCKGIDKDFHLISYYATKEQKKAIYENKHKLMYFKNAKGACFDTDVFFQNDDGEYFDAFHIPVAKINSLKNVKKMLENINNKFYDGITFYAEPQDEHNYLVYLNIHNSIKSPRCFSITDVKASSIIAQRLLMKKLDKDELTLLDNNGDQLPENYALIKEPFVVHSRTPVLKPEEKVLE